MRKQKETQLPAVIKPSKVEADWEAIEGMYRAGLLSVREIARSHGLSHVAILKRAKAEGWARDLTAKIRQAVTTELVTSEVTKEDLVTERQIVEAAAAQVIALVRSHRKEIGRSRAMITTLMDQLEMAAEGRDLLERIIDDVEDGSTGASTKRREALFRAVALPAHATVLKTLVDALKTVVGLEREAFNVSAATSEPPAVESDEVRFDRLLTKIRARPRVIDVTPE